MIGAFDALHDTTQFITFSGSTGLDFSWDITETKGQGLTSTHDATVADSVGGSLGGGINIGRRLVSADDGVPGYAYPVSGRVLARSKKLLEVTPEALERRRLRPPRRGAADARPRAPTTLRRGNKIIPLTDFLYITPPTSQKPPRRN